MYGVCEKQLGVVRQVRRHVFFNFVLVVMGLAGWVEGVRRSASLTHATAKGMSRAIAHDVHARIGRHSKSCALTSPRSRSRWTASMAASARSGSEVDKARQHQEDLGRPRRSRKLS